MRSVEHPRVFALLPPVDELLCLDLGCGEGHNTGDTCGPAIPAADDFVHYDFTLANLLTRRRRDHRRDRHQPARAGR